MTKIRIEAQLLKEFRKLSSEGKGEVLAYAKWMRDVERQGEIRSSSAKGQRRKYRKCGSGSYQHSLY